MEIGKKLKHTKQKLQRWLFPAWIKKVSSAAEHVPAAARDPSDTSQSAVTGNWGGYDERRPSLASACRATTAPAQGRPRLAPGLVQKLARAAGHDLPTRINELHWHKVGNRRPPPDNEQPTVEQSAAIGCESVTSSRAKRPRSNYTDVIQTRYDIFDWWRQFVTKQSDKMMVARLRDSCQVEQQRCTTSL